MNKMTRKKLVTAFYLTMAGLCHISFADLCSSLTPDNMTSCGPLNVSRDSCRATGCCWSNTTVKNPKNLESLKNVHCYRSKHLNGTCMRYPKDGICFKYLNSSIPQFRDTPRFIDYNIGLNKTNALMEEFQGLVTVVGEGDVSESCMHKVRILLCNYVLSPCGEDGSPIQICRRECERFEKECPKTLQKLIGGARVSLSKSKADFVHIRLPDCNNVMYKEDLAAVNKKCYVTGLFNMTDEVPINGGSDNSTAIIAAVVVVVGLVVVGSVVFLLYRRRMNREERAKLEPGTPSMNLRGLGAFPSHSVKDHINNLCADDLLKSKMAIHDPKQIRQYPVDMIAYERDLGEGQFGQVFQGRAIGLNEQDLEAEVIVAVKTLKKGSSSEVKADFDQEACLMNYLSHPNIVRLLAVSAMEEPYCMVFEFMSNGDLSEYLRKSEPLVEDETKSSEENQNYLSQETLIKMCVDVAKGLKYLAGHRLIHRDVATRNCLVADDLTIKIADFGMSRDIYSNNYYKIERETVLPIRWLSPEAVMFGKFTIESDIYSYGVLLWEIFTFSMQPYYGYTNKEVLEFIAKGIHLAKPDFCPDFVYRIMKDCWAKEPELRPFYNTIIDRLHGKEATYVFPRSVPTNLQPDTGLYQNFPLPQNDEESSESGTDHEEPLISEETPKERSIDRADKNTVKTASSRDDDKKNVIGASNPLFKSSDKLRHSSDGSHGSASSGMDSEPECEDDVMMEKRKGNSGTQQSSNKKDNSLNRMNKTYV